MPGLINSRTYTGFTGDMWNTDEEGWRLDDQGRRTTMRVDPTGTVYDNGQQVGYVGHGNNLIRGLRPEQTGAITSSVDTENDLVESRFNRLMSSGSPLLEKARARAAEAANARGLINSSMAVQAGESAAMEAALPIASADAQTYIQTRLNNQEAQNAVNRMRLGNELESGLVRQRGDIERGLQELRGQQELGVQQLKGSQAVELANIEANYKSLIQTNSSAADLFKQLQNATILVESDVNTTAEQKAQATQRLAQILQAALTVIGAIGNVDLAGLLDFRTSVSVPSGQ